MKCLIVDDDFSVRESIQKILDIFCPDVEIVGSTANITDAEAVIKVNKIDLVFLDIEMPGGDGFELLERVTPVNFDIVFTTAHAAYAVKAIKYAAMDYLLKPLNVDEVRAAVEKARLSIGKKTLINEQIDVLRNNRVKDDFVFTKIALNTGGELEFFKLNEIIRCEADRAYCKFYLTNKKMLHISKPMAEYHDILTQASFIKVHKSHIVNLDHVVKYISGSGGGLVMSDDSYVNVSTRRKTEVLEALKMV